MIYRGSNYDSLQSRATLILGYSACEIGSFKESVISYGAIGKLTLHSYSSLGFLDGHSGLAALAVEANLIVYKRLILHCGKQILPARARNKIYKLHISLRIQDRNI